MSPPRRPRPSRFLSLVLAATLTACAQGPPPADSPEPAARETDADAHEGLNATLWVQTAVEYEGLARQTYAQAADMLEAALVDPDWSAAAEQLETGGFGQLPPAVILDVDETVLDNSAFQARLILDGDSYSTAIWNDWVREELADPVPGALEFTRRAEALGVRVFYVTNRRKVVEEATRANLARFGFPLSDREDRLLTRGEFDLDGDKRERRRHVAERYRILLLVGDNFGDFLSGVDVGLERRAEMAAEYASFWGRRWIVLPNPQYGSWEGALFDFDFGLSRQQQLAIKRSRLESARR